MTMMINGRPPAKFSFPLKYHAMSGHIPKTQISAHENSFVFGGLSVLGKTPFGDKKCQNIPISNIARNIPTSPNAKKKRVVSGIGNKRIVPAKMKNILVPKYGGENLMFRLKNRYRQKTHNDNAAPVRILNGISKSNARTNMNTISGNISTDEVNI